MREQERVWVRVEGLVQGVWFRASTQREAVGLDLTGWVRNEMDGSVMLEAQGRPEGLEELLAWLRDGPPNARVDGLEVRWIEAEPEETTFSVRR